MKRNNLYVKSLLVSILCLISACQSANHKPPKESDESGEKMDIQIIVDPDSNPDLNGRPSPVRLDIFQLAGDGEFKRAGFIDLVENPKEKLGEKLIQSNNYMFHPDTVNSLPIQLDSHLKYFGVVVSYLNLENSQWRGIYKKQDKTWYQFGGQYLYLEVGRSELKQISKKEMREKLDQYSERHPDDKSIKNGKLKSESNNLDKGIFRELAKD